MCEDLISFPIGSHEILGGHEFAGGGGTSSLWTWYHLFLRKNSHKNIQFVTMIFFHPKESLFYLRKVNMENE